ncbi:hypothetical protein EXIGLDRAFT_731331 [Exidia glandulosa HHB12029]|uniref:Uncharacterized protein n=1 Tax=Exidia glandulosa HHB12029 TaxID=1314781 RepID=A0A165BXN9_EXIGL|nr:hypothetical protein EXIGLDRAFT_731331 [Exidia glandulosa HHB12029]
MHEAAILILATTGPFLLVGLSCITFLLLKRVELRDEEDDDDYGDRLYRYHDSPDYEDPERGHLREKTPMVPAVRVLVSEQRNHMVDLLRSRWTTENEYARLEQEDGEDEESDAETDSGDYHDEAVIYS